MHPGRLLRENALPAFGQSHTEFAGLLGVLRQTLYSILTERQLATPLLAFKLAKLCGNGQKLWLALWPKHHPDKLGRAKRAELTSLSTLAAK